MGSGVLSRSLHQRGCSHALVLLDLHLCRRLVHAGCAQNFRLGRPTGDVDTVLLRGAQSEYLPPAALEGAVAQDEAQRQAEADEARRHGHALQTQEAITLRHRAAPLIEMLRRCQQASADIVWGV
jgi:hypothetical protein